MIRNNHFASLLGVIALSVLFFKLPGVPNLFGITECKSCTTNTPYLPMLAAAYFAFIIAIMLSFPLFPSLSVAIGGLFWSIGLMVTLTYFSTEWCLICLIAHACHISIWMTLLWSSKLKKPQKETLLGMKLSLVFTAPISVMALFSTLNFSFLIYGPHMNPSSDKLVQVGETVKTFQLNTEGQNLLSNSERVV